MNKNDDPLNPSRPAIPTGPPYPAFINGISPGPFYLGRYEAPQIGCICPPGADRECERADCPRKAR